MLLRVVFVPQANRGRLPGTGVSLQPSRQLCEWASVWRIFCSDLHFRAVLPVVCPRLSVVFVCPKRLPGEPLAERPLL